MPPVAALPGDLAFAHGHTLTGRLIATMTHSDITHVRVVVSPATGLCIEGKPPRADYGFVAPDDVLVHVPYGDKDDRQAAVLRAASCLGAPYGYLSYLSDLLMFCGFPYEFHRRNSRHCAQLAAYAVGFGLDADDPTPASLYAAVLALPGAHLL